MFRRLLVVSTVALLAMGCILPAMAWFTPFGPFGAFGFGPFGTSFTSGFTTASTYASGFTSVNGFAAPFFGGFWPFGIGFPFGPFGPFGIC
jgi:hypothetical protein